MQRKAGREGRLTAEQTQRLSAIGMRWMSAQELQWNRMYECAAEYVRSHAGISALLKDDGEPQLRLWYRRQERKRLDGKLSETQAQRLDALSS